MRVIRRSVGPADDPYRSHDAELARRRPGRRERGPAPFRHFLDRRPLYMVRVRERCRKRDWSIAATSIALSRVLNIRNRVGLLPNSNLTFWMGKAPG